MLTYAVCHRLMDIGGAELLMKTNYNGHTALHLAAERGMAELCGAMVSVCGWRMLTYADIC
jgi:aminoglycoside N3'-acetyltransferase